MLLCLGVYSDEVKTVHIRVSASNREEVEKLINQKQGWGDKLIFAIPLLVAVVAIIGIMLLL